MSRSHHQDPADQPGQRKRASIDDLTKAFEEGARGVPPTAAEGYWHTVGFITPTDDVLDFEPLPEEEPTTSELGEIKHSPHRSTSVIPELLEAPIIDAVIVDDDDAST